MILKFSIKNIKKGITTFLIITLATLAGLFYIDETGKSFQAFRDFSKFYASIILLFVFSDYLLGGLRIYLYSREINKEVSFRDCFNANLGNIFLGTVTPMQTGGGFAQLYILNKAGLQVSETIAVSIFNFLGTILFIYCSSLYVVFFGENIFGEMFTTAFQYSIVVFSFVLAVLVWSFFNPKVLTVFFQTVTKLISLFVPKKAQSLKNGINKFKSELDSYKELIDYYVFKRPIVIFLGIIISAILFTQKYFIAYLILQGFGIEIDFGSVFCVQVLINLIAYFSPTPGASGISEISSTTLTALIVPQTSILVAFTILWRFFLTYLGAFLGGLVLFKVMLRSNFDDSEVSFEELESEVEIKASESVT